MNAARAAPAQEQPNVMLAATNMARAAAPVTSTQTTMTEQNGAKFKAAITGQSWRTALGLPRERRNWAIEKESHIALTAMHSHFTTSPSSEESAVYGSQNRA